MIDYVGMVREFHEKYGHHINNKPEGYINDRILKLRFRLIHEETQEVFEALDQLNVIQVADGLADLLYVVFGTAISYGIPIDEIFAEVHRSNMTKSLEMNEFGKTVKGPDWEPPQIGKILMEKMNA